MKLGSVGMSTSHWYAIVALWFAPGAEEGHGTAQRARTYSTALVSKSDSTHGIQGYGFSASNSCLTSSQLLYLEVLSDSTE